MQEFTVKPDPDDPRLTRRVGGIDQEGRPIETAVVTERPLTLFLNGREIVTMMTIGDHPEYLGVGYLLNQNMLAPEDRIVAVDYDDDIETVVVRTDRETDFEDKLKKKTLTSGCAQGTVFGDLMEKFDEVRLDPDAILRTSWLYALTRKINTAPNLYLAAGAIHGCVLCEEDRPLLYMEDVGRHNAVDKIAGYMRLNHISPRQKNLLHDGPADLGDGDQDGADGHPDPGVALRLYRMGGRAGAAGRVDADRPRQGAALRRAGRRSTHRLRRRSPLDRRGAGAPVAQGEPRRGGRRVTVVGLLLAGGQSRRMGGGDKALRLLGGRTILDHVIERLRPQVAALVLDANGDPARFAGFGLPVVADSIADFAGPLAGILAGLDWTAAHRPDCPIVASVPTDAPFLPQDLVARLAGGMEAEGAELACAASGGQPHPVVGLWPVRLREALRHAVVAEGIRKVDVWTGRYRLASVPFADTPIDPFFNANRPEDLAAAAALLARAEG